jgi:hypothetical protein
MQKQIANDNRLGPKVRGNLPPSFQLRVWWIPQVPMSPFLYPVPTVEAAEMLCDALARYDLFQYENNVKGDYSNAGGASWQHPELTGGEWLDFNPEDEYECEEVVAAIAKLKG